MKARILLLCIFTTIFIISACSGDGNNRLTKQEKKDGWVLLFDGKTTKGWRGYNKSDIGSGWFVKEGILTCLGKGGDIGGDIIHDEQFDNFELRVDWKISKGGNSGIFYHVIEGEIYSAPYQTGPEYQLIDDINFPGDLKEWQQAGADYAMYIANDKKKLKPVGEWNCSKIVFDNGHVEHWLNGEKILEFTAWSEDWQQKKETGKWKDFPDYGLAQKGYVGLQDHGNNISFRNIKIKKL